jgi:hypothetical protein
MSEESPIVDEVRRRAGALSARFDDDLAKYVAHLREVQRQHSDRVVAQVRVVREDSHAGTLKV